MDSYLITYDLRAPGRNYEELYAALKAYPDWAKATESTWFIKSSETCTKVRDDLLQSIDSNDRLLVVKLCGVGAWYNLIASSEKIKQIL